MQILAATDFSTRSHRALRLAGLLAQAKSAELALVHVVDDDQPNDLVEIESGEAERILNEQITAIAELRGARCCPMVVPGDPFDGILRTARSIQADLIVMGAHRKQLLRDIFVGTTILAELAPVAIASGTTPRMKASEVMTMGRKRSRAASTAASKIESPPACRSGATSTMRMAFLADSPIKVTRPTWK